MRNRGRDRQPWLIGQDAESRMGGKELLANRYASVSSAISELSVGLKPGDAVGNLVAIPA